jgi:high affinity Mn2+ porin
MKILLFMIVSLITNNPARAQLSRDSSAIQNWNIHFQQTVVGQHHPHFSAKYSGRNSLQTHSETQTSLTSTLFLGARLWRGAEAYFNPEMAGGSGLSAARGIAGFPNGETFRVGAPKPTIYLARLFVKQIFTLSDEKQTIDDDQNQLAGKIPTSYVALSAGKFCLKDLFDNNKYSNDPRTQFLNWSLMANAGWDYPANVRGYTIGFVIEYVKPLWTLRFASTLVPKEANGPSLDYKFSKARSESFEFERNFTMHDRPSVLRLLTFFTQANMGNYKEAVNPIVFGPGPFDITQTRKSGRTKYGFGLNFEQDWNENVGYFVRAGWNDGKNETWAYTEIDNSVSAGFSLKGRSWKRPHDHVGLAVVSNGISADHRNYLRSGGYGFIIGDGQLRYSRENILETYYSFQLNDFFWISPNYQFIANPAYNKDRGPVHVFALRVHTEI